MFLNFFTSVYGKLNNNVDDIKKDLSCNLNLSKFISTDYGIWLTTDERVLNVVKSLQIW